MKHDSIIDTIKARLTNAELSKMNEYDFAQSENYTGNEPLLEVLMVSSYPPRECGIATYTQDLIRALNDKFYSSFKLSICALESASEKHTYDEVKPKFILETDKAESYSKLSRNINNDSTVQAVLFQHEFGFYHQMEQQFIEMLDSISKPVMVVFHTVLPSPSFAFLVNVQTIADRASSLIVMTENSKRILVEEYSIDENLISVIPHGTHLVPHEDKEKLKEKHGFSGRKILSTFGLLSSGKSIETSLDALPKIVTKNPEVLFLIIGKTHPNIVKHEGEQYREMLQEKVRAYGLENHVHFINHFIALPDLLEYLQLTDIYLFTSKDPNQAVSGTFSYAMSCGCPIVSTPIPHATEVLQNNAGFTFDFGDSNQLALEVNKLLADDQLRKDIGLNALHAMAGTAWENTAIAHAQLFSEMMGNGIKLKYKIPEWKMNHLERMTTEKGLFQFAQINQPDPASGYTLDDNARALIVVAHKTLIEQNEQYIDNIRTYLNFIKGCQQVDGSFLNYVDSDGQFTSQNEECNLEDANGRAIWALGYLISISHVLPQDIINDAEEIFESALNSAHHMHSTRAMAFVLKGLYYRSTKDNIIQDHFLIRELANRLVQMYRHETDHNWRWFESYMTYANSILPEALLCAWLATGKPVYKEVAYASFNFLLSKIFTDTHINVISNKGWMHRGAGEMIKTTGGEQPIDVAYTIIALKKFYEVFKEPHYREKIDIAFNWFLGNNHMKQIMYNPCTGGCFDGLEENYINLNQGAESTISYLMARLAMESILQKESLIQKEKMLLRSIA